MTKTRHLSAGLLVALASLLTGGSAYALNDHSWISSGGSGIACTRAAPCSNFGIAHDGTNPGGVISVLDPRDYGSVVVFQNLSPFGLKASMVGRQWYHHFSAH